MTSRRFPVRTLLVAAGAVAAVALSPLTAWAQRLPVGSRVKVQITGQTSFDTCTVLEDRPADLGYVVRCDPNTTSAFVDQFAPDRWITPIATPAPAALPCPKGGPPRVRSTKASAALFKSVIWEQFRTGSSANGTVVGMTFERFQAGAAFKNRPGAPGGLPLIPAGTTVYPYTSSYTTCQQRSSSWLVSKVDVEFRCMKDRSGAWTCGNGVPTIRATQVVPT